MIKQSILLYKRNKPQYLIQKSLTQNHIETLIQEAKEYEILPGTHLKSRRDPHHILLVHGYEKDLTKIYFVKEDPAFIRCTIQTILKNPQPTCLGYSLNELINDYLIIPAKEKEITNGN